MLVKLTILFVLGFLVILPGVKKDPANPVSCEDILNSPKSDWLTYSGDYLSQRHSPLRQINDKNISSLKLKWEFKIGDSENTRGTPLVHDGVMYATNANGVFAIDATKRKEVWHWKVPASKVSGLNRGVALLNNEVFFVTSDCRITALNQTTGELLWQNKYTYYGQGYYCTLAPLALKDRVIVGVSLEETSHSRGFVIAFDAKTGKEIWRFWTTPSPKEWGATTWMSGSYDPESNTVYWTTGSPLPNSVDEKNRPGDSLYSNCLLALDADTGKLKWYFQFTPHDNHHWDSNEIPVLVNEFWSGKNRKLILQANRNGLFYVLDRAEGKFIFGKPFVKCPNLFGATNWMSPSYNPRTKLFYVVAIEGCGQEADRNYIKAIDIFSGETKWSYKLSGVQLMSAGVLSTSGNLVFTSDKDKNFIALNAKTGQPLWRHHLRYSVFASPISYAVNGVQYVAMSAGETICVFSLF